VELVTKLNVTRLKPKKKESSEQKKEPEEKIGSVEGENIKGRVGSQKMAEEAREEEESLLQKRNYLEVEQSGTLHVPLAPKITQETSKEEQSNDEASREEPCEGSDDERNLSRESSYEEKERKMKRLTMSGQTYQDDDSGSGYLNGSGSEFESDSELRRLARNSKLQQGLEKEAESLRKEGHGVQSGSQKGIGGIQGPTLMKKVNYSLDTMNFEDFYVPK
jgi:hypothetical protein